MKRMPAVAGSFYPETEQGLRSELKKLLSGPADRKQAIGLIVPHAGYIFSGAIAATGYQAVDIPATVLLLGPNHQGLGPQASIYARGSWQTPLGNLPVAETLADDLLNNCDLLEADELAHRFEHSLEVQLPFLQALRDDLRILPISLGHGPLDGWLTLGRQIGEALSRNEEQVLLLASTDMNHFASAAYSTEVDHLAITEMENYDPAGLFRLVRERQISMCGVIPTVVLLEAAKILGASSCRLLRYGHSGEVNGDLSSVVGYASLVVT